MIDIIDLDYESRYTIFNSHNSMYLYNGFVANIVLIYRFGHQNLMPTSYTRRHCPNCTVDCVLVVVDGGN